MPTPYTRVARIFMLGVVLVHGKRSTWRELFHDVGKNGREHLVVERGKRLCWIGQEHY